MSLLIGEVILIIGVYLVRRERIKLEERLSSAHGTEES